MLSPLLNAGQSRRVLASNNCLIYDAIIYPKCEAKYVTKLHYTDNLGIVTEIVEIYMGDKCSDCDNIYVRDKVKGNLKVDKSSIFLYMHNGVPRAELVVYSSHVHNYMEWRSALSNYRTKNYRVQCPTPPVSIYEKCKDIVDTWAETHARDVNQSIHLLIDADIIRGTNTIRVEYNKMRALNIPIYRTITNGDTVLIPETYMDRIKLPGYYDYILSKMSICDTMEDKISAIPVNRVAYCDVDFVFSE
jgi:hypothetical protein